MSERGRSGAGGGGGKRGRRRYALRDDELNAALEALVEQAAERYGADDERAVESVRQLMVTSLRLLRDEASRGDLKLANHAMKELRHAFRVFEPYSHMRKVAVFGSARTAEDDPDFIHAHAFAEQIVREGWMVITGAGGGIMHAAQGGAGRDSSFGVNIRLPFEQHANDVIAGDHKLINFRYFFTRKVTFVKEAHAIALFPGGFGTHDEGFEALTLIQTGKGEIMPIVFVDRPGGSYWRDWEAYVHSHLRDTALISESDLSLFTVTDDLDVAVSEILNFYSNYHSSRYLGDTLVLRVRLAPGPEELDALNADFADIVAKGKITVGDPLSGEGDEAPGYSRVMMKFDRRSVGRLREMIDRLNALVGERSSPAGEASPHEIVESPFSEEFEIEEDED